MNLLKTSLLNGIAVVVRMASLLAINKILAIFVGPSGYAALGQFQNAMQVIATLANGAISNGVVKYTAEYSDNISEQHKIWRTAGFITLFSSLSLSALVFIFKDYLTLIFLGENDLSIVFVCLSLTLTFLSLNGLLLAILNGTKEIVSYVIANILGSVFSLVFTALLTVKFQLLGALIALATYQSITFVSTLIFCVRAKRFMLKDLIGFPDKIVFENLIKFSAMAVVSAVCVPASSILVRSHLSFNFGEISAGYWEAIFRFSSAYLMLVTTTLSVYYLPRLSELSSKMELKDEIINGYKVIMPVVIGIGILVFVLRKTITQLLFSKEFDPVEDLFLWELIGDIFKVASWLLAYFLISKAFYKTFILLEIFFSASFYFITITMTGFFNLKGVVIAHAINYFLYFFVMYLIVFKFYLSCNEENS